MFKKLGFFVLVGVFTMTPFMASASFETCMAGIIHDRDTSVMAENTTFYTVLNNHINLRMAQLSNHWLTITDPALRKDANKATWDDFRAKKIALKASHNNAIQNIWGNYFAYRAQCKANNSPIVDFDGTPSSDL